MKRFDCDKNHRKSSQRVREVFDQSEGKFGTRRLIDRIIKIEHRVE
jgi:hypothetical protein